MKKLFTILSLLCLTMVAQAQEVTTWDTAGDLVTFEDFKASAGTGKRYAFRMPSISLRGWCNFQSKAAVDANKLQAEHLFMLEKSANDEEAFWLKRFTDQKYLNLDGEGGFDAFEGVDLYLDNRTPGFTDPEEQYADHEAIGPYYISMDNAEGKHFNNGNFGFFGGTGGWSAYYAYGPFYMVSVQCVDQYSDEVAPPAQFFGLAGATFTITPPEVLGFKTTETEKTVTLGEGDQNITIYYEAVSSVTYTLNIVNAPAGVTLTIDGENVALNATEYVASRVLEKDDIVVELGELEYRSSVTINGTTITIKFYDNRYGINFDPDQTYTHTAQGGRKTHWVALGDQKVEWEFQGVGVEPVYRDMTDQTIKVPAGATVTPSIGFEGQFMHGFLYIDYNNNGVYDVDDLEAAQTPWSTEPNGELVSYKNQGNVLNTNSRNLPDITVPESGTYRVRFKVDWASLDPGGNTGADPEDVASSNHIVANGGCIIDVMLEVVTGYTVNYQVLDESGAVLKEKTAEVIGGSTIDAIPADLLLPDFYTYSEMTPVTVNSDVTVTVTATLKDELPFQFTSDATNPMWYILKNMGNDSNPNGAYPTYEDGGDPNVTLPTELTEDETTQWAFIGSPYAGFKIVNKAAGTGLILGANDIFNEFGEDDNAKGGNTYAVLAEPGTYPNELWFPKSSTHAENGFFLYSKEGYALNLRSNIDLAFWTGGADKGSTFVVVTILSGDDKIANAQKELDELTAGANEVQIGYPTADALATLKATIDDIAKGYKGGSIEASDLSRQLNEALALAKEAANVNYEPRTDVYYTITNTRGSIVYNPEKAENVDGNGSEFLWFTKELNKEDANHQWGIYKQGEDYYLYNVGKQLFANVTTTPAEGATKFFSKDGGGCWMFSKVPAKVMFDGGDTSWVPAPNVRIQGTASITDELGAPYENDYTMSVSESYVGPVITFYDVDDAGVPMTFAIATETQDPAVTAYIEALLSGDGIETIDNGQSTINNGAIYNLQGQKVKKAQKGVYIQNGKKVVLK